jgi:Branched-chain amino acid transport system / permease component
MTSKDLDERLRALLSHEGFDPKDLVALGPPALASGRTDKRPFCPPALPPGANAISLSGVLNFAQGEFLLLGGYVFWALVEGHAPWPYAAALTILFSIVLGLALERLILRPMIGEPIRR